MPDHFGERPGFWPAIVAGAEATSTLRFGTMTVNNDLWNPVILARDAATADVFTEGRIELGLGAGWRAEDYRWTGVPKDPIGTRIARLAESVAVIRGCLGGTPFDFEGVHFKVNGVEGWPRPVQVPLPIFIGGSGPRILRLAGREAEVVGIHVNLNRGGFDGLAAHDVEGRVEGVRRESAGRLPQPELHLFILELELTPNRREAAQRVAAELGIEVEQALESPYLYFGTVNEVVAQIEACRARFGISYFTVRDAHVEPFAAVVERLAGR